MSLRAVIDAVDETSQMLSDISAVAMRRQTELEPDTSGAIAAEMLVRTADAARMLVDAAKHTIGAEPNGDGLTRAIETTVRALGTLYALDTVWKAVDEAKRREQERDDEGNDG